MRRRLSDLQKTKCLPSFQIGIQAGLQTQNAAVLLNTTVVGHIPCRIPFKDPVEYSAKMAKYF